MKTVNVVAAIIHREGKVLSTQRGPGAFEGGWEFPGGKIEPGELPEEAIKREIKEELAADITVEKLVYVLEHDYETYHLHMQCFSATLKSDITLLEHTDAKWLGACDLESVAWLPADLPVLDEIRRQGLVS